MHQKQRLRNAYDRCESLVPNQKSEVQNVSLNFLIEISGNQSKETGCEIFYPKLKK